MLHWLWVLIVGAIIGAVTLVLIVSAIFGRRAHA